MSERQSWKFPYTADILWKAAAKKSEHFKSRLDWWTKKRAEIIKKIKDEGLEFDDSLAANNALTFSNATYSRGPTVNIRNDLLRDLQECSGKIQEHENNVKNYVAWIEVLHSQGQSTFNLHQDDWLFFFGK